VTFRNTCAAQLPGLQAGKALRELVWRRWIVEAVPRPHGVRQVARETRSIGPFVKLLLHAADEPVVLVPREVRVGRVVIAERIPFPQKVANRLSPRMRGHAISSTDRAGAIDEHSPRRQHP
jgi:hypothetical protein